MASLRDKLLQQSLQGEIGCVDSNPGAIRQWRVVGYSEWGVLSGGVDGDSQTRGGACGWEQGALISST